MSTGPASECEGGLLSTTETVDVVSCTRTSGQRQKDTAHTCTVQRQGTGGQDILNQVQEARRLFVDYPLLAL